MLAMMRLGRDGRRGLEQTTFGAWLEQHGQPAALIDNFYNPLLLGALNEDCRLASAAAAIQVFQDALLSHSGGYFLGLPTCPLARLYAAGPCRDVRLAARVAEVRIVGDRVAGLVLHNGQILHADVYILATNHHTVRKLLGGDAALIDSRLPGLERLESAPILGAHLWFDRPLLRESHSAIIHGPLQWVFRKDAAGKAVHGVISAAWDWLDVPRDQCLKMFAQQLASAFPEAADAKLERGIIVIEKRATFRPLPGMEHLRPSQAPPAGGIANLFLAGDYTQTGWPATMEGAIRGGYLAAEAVLNATGHPRRFLVPDLPSQWPMRLLGRAGGRTRRQL